MSNAYDLPEVEVASNSTANVISLPVSPGKAFYPEWLLVPDDVAEQFAICDVKVGRNSQVVGDSSFPASLFAESSPRDRLLFDHLQADLRFVLMVTNVSGQAARWRGRVVGCCAPEPDLVKPRGAILGLGRTEVPAGSSALLSAQSQVEVRPRRLHVPRHLLDSFSVDDLFVGPYLDQPQGSKTSPSSLSRENLLDRGQVALEPCDLLGIGTFVTVAVTNRSPRSLAFTAALVADLCQK